nr:hypothetical protein [Tanacetum cinerariifolium]
ELAAVNNISPKCNQDTGTTLIEEGFTLNYTSWWAHGETSSRFQHEGQSSTMMEDDDVDGCTQMVMDATGPTIFNSASFEPNSNSNSSNEQPPNPSAKGFYDMLAATDEPLWDGPHSFCSFDSVIMRHAWEQMDRTTPIRSYDPDHAKKKTIPRGIASLTTLVGTKDMKPKASYTLTKPQVGVQKSIHTNTSRTNATMSSDTRVQKSIQTTTSITRFETNTGVQKGENEPNTDASQCRRGLNIIEQVPRDPSKRIMISLDGGEFTDPKAHFKELFKWEGVSDVLVHDVWENSMKKRYSDIMSKARGESMKLEKAVCVRFEGIDCTILKPHNPEWIKSKHWEDMIDRIWKTKK